MSRCIAYISDVKYRKLNLQKGQFTFLTRICENNGINQIDLSNSLKVDKTTTTKAIQKLIEAGYIYKKRDCADKRMWRLYPEKKALDIYMFIIAEENRNIKVCLDNFSEEEKTLVCKLVKRMSGNIEKEWKEVKKKE